MDGKVKNATKNLLDAFNRLTNKAKMVDFERKVRGDLETVLGRPQIPVGTSMEVARTLERLTPHIIIPGRQSVDLQLAALMHEIQELRQENKSLASEIEIMHQTMMLIHEHIRRMGPLDPRSPAETWFYRQQMEKAARSVPPRIPTGPLDEKDLEGIRKLTDL